MKSFMEKAQYLFINGKYEELRVLFQQATIDDRQGAFERYIKKGTLMRGKLIPCQYGMIDQKQVFTNGETLYVMKKPFTLSDTYIDRIPEDLENGTIRPIKKSEEDLMNLVEKAENYVQNSNAIGFSDDELIVDNTITITSEYNQASFKSDYIKQMYQMLGFDTNLKLSNNNPAILGENSIDKVYILGIRSSPSIEIRRLHTR